MKPKLVMDFDGTCTDYKDWKGIGEIPDAPVKGLQSFLDEALDYFDVYIVSSRSAEKEGRLAMEKWFRDHFGPMADEIFFPEHKPPAHVTLDDRALTFKGKYPPVKYLRSFKPWNKKRDSG